MSKHMGRIPKKEPSCGLTGIAVDESMKPTGLRGKVFDTILSALKSDEVIELHEIVEDIMAKADKHYQEQFNELKQVKSELEQTKLALKEARFYNNENLTKVSKLKVEVDQLRARNKRQKEKEEKDHDQINYLESELGKAKEELHKYTEDENSECMASPNTNNRPTVNVYFDDFEKMQRKIDVLLEAIKKI